MNSRPVVAIVCVALAVSGCLRSNSEPPAALARERLVSNPSSIAFLSTERAEAGLGAELRFGGPLGRSALLLKFRDEWRARGIPQQAFLTLSAREGSARADTPVTLEVWRISADWDAQTLRRWSEKPSLAPPYARTRITPSASRDTQIDVTEIVRFAAHNPERDFGIAVIATSSEGPAATFSSGLAGGAAPRLEIYLR